MTQHDIKIGTMVGGKDCDKLIKKIKKYGFETFAVNFWQDLGGCDLKVLAEKVKAELDGTDIEITTIGVYGNTLTNEKNLEGWKEVIDNAHLFGAKIVTGFAGGLEGQSVDKSMPKFKEVFTELTKMAADKGLKIAIENCQMRGTWNSVTQNIGFHPRAWEMMFSEVPAENLGLQWEPCHQLLQLINPMTQLDEKWIPKIFNVHGKDATVDRAIIERDGIIGPVPYSWSRTPGFGDSNWADIISRLRLFGYKGSIDIEGWHDPVYKGELEYTGQVHALNYLKYCRGGEYITLD